MSYIVFHHLFIYQHLVMNASQEEIKLLKATSVNACICLQLHYSVLKTIGSVYI